MKVQELFEASGHSDIEKFVITMWGRLLYLSYSHLPIGKDNSNHPELRKAMRDWNQAEKDGDEDEIASLEEWIGEGASINGGNLLLNKTTVDAVLRSASETATSDFPVYRFDHSPNKIRKGSWISMTRQDGKTYHTPDDKKRTFVIHKGDKFVDGHGLADKHEVIVWSDDVMDQDK